MPYRVLLPESQAMETGGALSPTAATALLYAHTMFSHSPHSGISLCLPRTLHLPTHTQPVNSQVPSRPHFRELALSDSCINWSSPTALRCQSTAVPTKKLLLPICIFMSPPDRTVPETLTRAQCFHQ